MQKIIEDSLKILDLVATGEGTNINLAYTLASGMEFKTKYIKKWILQRIQSRKEVEIFRMGNFIFHEYGEKLLHDFCKTIVDDEEFQEYIDSIFGVESKMKITYRARSKMLEINSQAYCDNYKNSTIYYESGGLYLYRLSCLDIKYSRIHNFYDLNKNLFAKELRKTQSKYNNIIEIMCKHNPLEDYISEGLCDFDYQGQFVKPYLWAKKIWRYYRKVLRKFLFNAKASYIRYILSQDGRESDLILCDYPTKTSNNHLRVHVESSKNKKSKLYTIAKRINYDRVNQAACVWTTYKISEVVENIKEHVKTPSSYLSFYIKGNGTEKILNLECNTVK